MTLHAVQVEFEGALYIGTVIFAVLYGAYLGIYCLSTCALLSNANTTQSRRLFYITFSSVLLLLNTIVFLSLPYIGQRMWITMRGNYPGYPLEYYDIEINHNKLYFVGNAAQNLAILLNDGLLVYNRYTIFGSKSYVVILPTLLTLGAFALGMATIPSYLPSSSKINAAGIGLDTIVNVMITTMITIRILAAARSVSKSTQSRKKQSKTYINTVAILVESATPCAILGIMTCIVQFMISSGSASAFLSYSEVIALLWSASIALSPQLIIYRIARGSAWTSTTYSDLTQTSGNLGSVHLAVDATGVSDTDHLP